jgi:hypothetical protein
MVTDAGRGIIPGHGNRNTGVSGAVFTSTNPAVDDPDPSSTSTHDLCLNAKDDAPAIDCNIYRQKNYVWLSGGPGPSDLEDGTYVFAVLVPSGQGSNDAPNDCTISNLSDTSPCNTSNTGAGDTWQHRVFSVSSGVITYPAAGYLDGHDFVNGMIRLMGYDDTTNPGGEYVMAVCNLADATFPEANGPGVDPSDCKYDNFKVRPFVCVDDCGGSPQGVTVVTEVHDANHNVITGPLYIPAFSSITVHDKATVSTLGDPAADIPLGSTFQFYFFTTTDCSGTPVGPDTHAVSGPSPQSYDGGLPQTISTPGNYSYQANFYSGNLATVSDGVGDCEPFTVAAQLGKTMGFWGNQNGIAYITGHGGYAGANAISLGRGSNIDTQAEAQKVLPLTLNACGKGTTIIFTGQTASANCSLATGINIGTLNTDAAQALALWYNIRFVGGFAGQTITALGCSAYLTASLTGANTVNDALAAAINLINHSASGGTTTQAQLGAMNLLLNCLNRES